MKARFWMMTLMTMKRKIRANKHLDQESLATAAFRFEVAEVNRRLAGGKAHLMTKTLACMSQKPQMQIEIL